MGKPREKNALILVDCQVDFLGHANGTPYSLPYEGGTYTAALPVGGGVEDMERICDYIVAEGAHLHAIVATLDSHNPLQIFHPGYWRDRGGNPAVVDFALGKFPFVITPKEIRSGDWTPFNALSKYTGINPVDPSKPMTGYDWALHYTEQLEQNNKDPLTIWTNHCLIGTVGYNLYPRLARVLREWSVKYGRTVHWKVKGNNMFTEHYGGLEAEVVIDSYRDTMMDMDLVKMLQQYDRVLFAGEASSHCVLNTVKQVVTGFGSAPLDRLCLLTDAMSPVGLPGYPERAKEFIDHMAQLGMKTSTTKAMPLAA